MHRNYSEDEAYWLSYLIHVSYHHFLMPSVHYFSWMLVINPISKAVICIVILTRFNMAFCMHITWPHLLHCLAPGNVIQTDFASVVSPQRQKQQEISQMNCKEILYWPLVERAAACGSDPAKPESNLIRIVRFHCDSSVTVGRAQQSLCCAKPCLFVVSS